MRDGDDLDDAVDGLVEGLDGNDGGDAVAAHEEFDAPTPGARRFRRLLRPNDPDLVDVDVHAAIDADAAHEELEGPPTAPTCSTGTT